MGHELVWELTITNNSIGKCILNSKQLIYSKQKLEHSLFTEIAYRHLLKLNIKYLLIVQVFLFHLLSLR